MLVQFPEMRGYVPYMHGAVKFEALFVNGSAEIPDDHLASIQAEWFAVTPVADEEEAEAVEAEAADPAGRIEEPTPTGRIMGADTVAILIDPNQPPAPAEDPKPRKGK